MVTTVRNFLDAKVMVLKNYNSLCTKFQGKILVVSKIGQNKMKQDRKGMVQDMMERT